MFGEDSWESLGLQGDPTSPFWRRPTLGFLWKEWCWSWNSSTLATSCEELTHWKRLWCWKGLGAGGEGDDRGWDGWMASLTRWTWVWVNSRSWRWTGSLTCCDSWSCKESDTQGYTQCQTEQLKWIEATVRTGHGATDWFQTGKGVRQGCILSPCLFNFYAEYIMRNAGLEEAQARIKTVARNINPSDMQMTPPLWQKVKRN